MAELFPSCRPLFMVAVALSAFAATVWPAFANAPSPAGRRPLMAEPSKNPAVNYRPVDFASLEGWAGDDHAAAFQAFLRSCERIAGRRQGSGPADPRLAVCRTALATARDGLTRDGARAFFETNFVPHRVVHRGPRGMVTGYYEPVLKGSRTPRRGYATPVLRRPPDLVNLVPETRRGAKAHVLTHARLMPGGKRVAYPTRQEIEKGALAGQGLEILYLANPVDLFFMQIQGSGRVDLGNGSSVRLTYDGKNGHPYTSVGRYLIDAGLFAAEQVSLQSLETWLKADAERGRKAMWQNKSYVFFRELAPGEDQGPLGAMSIPLTAGRSLAVDTTFHALGLPVWVAAPALTHATKHGGFHRLMVAQDVGSAIRGPERGDIYFGSGAAAGKKAGVTKHAASFIVLLPKGDSGREEETAGRRPAKRTETAGQQ